MFNIFFPEASISVGNKGSLSVCGYQADIHRCVNVWIDFDSFHINVILAAGTKDKLSGCIITDAGDNTGLKSEAADDCCLIHGIAANRHGNAIYRIRFNIKNIS